VAAPVNAIIKGLWLGWALGAAHLEAESTPRTHVYLAFGDSLTDGDGSSDGCGYRLRLESRLKARFGQASVIGAGATGTDSHRGARRIGKALDAYRPAGTLILYGTNDWDDREDRSRMTLNSLSRIVESVKHAGSRPYLATLIPTHLGGDARASAERNRWVARVNDGIRALARAEAAVLVDLEAAFAERPDHEALYADGLHPNDAGYEVMAEAFFAAIVQAAPTP
jgi:lysophospholipase L1-like esterase